MRAISPSVMLLAIDQEYRRTVARTLRKDYARLRGPASLCTILAELASHDGKLTVVTLTRSPSR